MTDIDNNKCKIINEKKNSELKTKKKKKNRCVHCKKNVGLLGFKCKCGKLFCSNHLHPECHNCSYDYKSEQISILSSNLEKIDGKKIIEI